MKKIAIFIILILVVSSNVFTMPVDEKWGISACVTPWIDNREFTLSRQLSKTWTILFWGDFSADRNEIPGDEYFNIDNGYKWLVGPEFRKKLYYSEEHKIAPYLGVLVNGGYEKYDMSAIGNSEYQKKHYAYDGGVELTFGVEYFITNFISVNIHTRFFKYHYYWINLDTFYRSQTNYKTGYHIWEGFDDPPCVFIRFYF